MPGAFVSSAADEAVFRALLSREPIFHRPEHAATPADFEAMVEPTFWEVGASGRIYNREVVLDILARRLADPPEYVWDVCDPACLHVAPDLFLFTYTLYEGEQQERVTRRATLWRRHTDGWRIQYHQGTIVGGD
ncbi:MAG: DUF4440 domain-containing protein [Chloroflexota bacterium]